MSIKLDGSHLAQENLHVSVIPSALEMTDFAIISSSCSSIETPLHSVLHHARHSNTSYSLPMLVPDSKAVIDHKKMTTLYMYTVNVCRTSQLSPLPQISTFKLHHARFAGRRGSRRQRFAVSGIGIY